MGVSAIPTPRQLIIWHPTATPPAGYIKANGATLSRTAYAWLFQQIGTTWGAGDGATTFKIPDLRGEFLRGLDEGRGVDSGRVLASNQAFAMQTHTHGYMAPALASSTNAFEQNAYWATQAATSDPNSGNSASETRPRNVAAIYCIAYAP